MFEASVGAAFRHAVLTTLTQMESSPPFHFGLSSNREPAPRSTAHPDPSPAGRAQPLTREPEEAGGGVRLSRIVRGTERGSQKEPSYGRTPFQVELLFRVEMSQ